MKTKTLLIGIAMMLFASATQADSNRTVVSASINPAEFTYYSGTTEEAYTIITWNDASTVELITCMVWGYVTPMEENVDYTIMDIDGETARLTFLREEKFRTSKSTASDDDFIFTINFNIGDSAIFTIIPEVENMYGVYFWVSDPDGNSIEDATLTFDGTTFEPGNYDAGLYLPGIYPYSIFKSGYITAEGTVELSEPASVSVTLFPEGITGLPESIKFVSRIYPNPATDNVTIEFPESENVVIEICSLEGKIVHHLNASGKSTTLNISELQRGVYIIRVNSAIGFQAIRMVKK
ncbi:MAG: hypothetical protein CVT94_00435 [Bacteroidetes bacterium HGW-Bacteroidetes-11]|jgi:hypothetical protein|nr:MAG: hypothetical protein CVT94_00435 [Bacteroidetes bacterium HGW-Bacteroidetes-11]